MEDTFYIRIHGVWYDFTGYHQHPGGIAIFREYNRRDATHKFESIGFHLGNYVQKQLPSFKIIDDTLIEELERGLAANLDNTSRGK
jgi:cytochrome b involved in lipid metabolism